MAIDLDILKKLLNYGGLSSELSTYSDQGLAVYNSLFLNECSHSESDIDLISTYIAAHLFVISQEKGGLAYRKIGESSDTYLVPNRYATGFESSRFGQMAIILDKCRVLANLSGKGENRIDIQVGGL